MVSLMGDGIGPANGNERATAEYSINFREHLLVLQWIKSFHFFCGQVVYISSAHPERPVRGKVQQGVWAP